MCVYLPDSLKSAVDRELWSELEGKVPFGAYNNLWNELIRNWLADRGITV